MPSPVLRRGGTVAAYCRSTRVRCAAREGFSGCPSPGGALSHDPSSLSVETTVLVSVVAFTCIVDTRLPSFTALSRMSRPLGIGSAVGEARHSVFHVRTNPKDLIQVTLPENTVYMRGEIDESDAAAFHPFIGV